MEDMVNQNKNISFKIKRQAKHVFPSEAKRTVDLFTSHLQSRPNDLNGSGRLRCLTLQTAIDFHYTFYTITKTRLYNFDPLKPHFYIVNLRFTGYTLFFLISAQKHRLWVLIRTASPRRF